MPEVREDSAHLVAMALRRICGDARRILIVFRLTFSRCFRTICPRPNKTPVEVRHCRLVPAPYNRAITLSEIGRVASRGSDIQAKTFRSRCVIQNQIRRGKTKCRRRVEAPESATPTDLNCKKRFDGKGRAQLSEQNIPDRENARFKRITTELDTLFFKESLNHL